jgi:S-adenosylmethionine:tRNA ribosyltransferase-isomerase
LPGLSFFIETPDGQGLKGELVVGSKDMPQGTVVARFDRDPVSSGAGKLPLPHYLKRAPQAEDESSYQTVYAQNLGSAAAPTAGLHFTDSVRQKLSDRGVRWEELTLHVGLGTFRPVKSEVVTHHQMHEERFEISEHTAKAVTEAKRSHRRVCAIGTTSVRALESAWDSSEGVLKSGASRTSIFIRPGKHEFRVVDALLTNFHLPKSTLLMLVCSLAGYDLVMKAYREAVAQEYRFFSYGDAMLIL